MNYKPLLVMFILLNFYRVYAVEPKKEDLTDAKQKTQQFLKDKKQREEFANQDKNAKKAVDNVKALTNGNEQTEQKIYELSSEIFNNLGDSPEAMMKAIEEAQRNPAEFAKKFSPEQQKKLKEIAAEIEKGNASKKP
jgi:hypothetical protein